MSVSPLDWVLPDAMAMTFSLGSLRAGALPLPSDWSVMMQRPCPSPQP